MFTAGVRATMATTHRAIPLLLQTGRGIIVNIAAWDRGRYLGALIYDTAKAAIVRFTATLAHELRHHGIAVVAVFPGFTSTERVRMAGAEGMESPEYTGRGVASLSQDPQLLTRSGRGYRIGDLARECGFTDIDGQQPEPFALPEELILAQSAIADP
jgi:NAD(P)-dependent dehydrogenase (short-subunit alcohol dehydrogenase family)